MGDLGEATDPPWPGPASRLPMWPETSVMQSTSSFTRCVDFFIEFLYLFRVCFRISLVSVFSYLCSVCNLSVLRHFFCVASSSLACFFYSKELIRCQLLLLEFDCIWICVCTIISAFWSVCICLLSDARLTVGTRAPPNNWAIVTEVPMMPVSRIEVRSNFRSKSLLRSVQVLNQC